MIHEPEFIKICKNVKWPDFPARKFGRFAYSIYLCIYNNLDFVKNRESINLDFVKNETEDIHKCIRRYGQHLATPYVVHAADLKQEEGIVYLPLYMVPLL